MDNKVLSNAPNENYLYLAIKSNMNKKELKCEASNGISVSSQTASYLIELSCN